MLNCLWQMLKKNVNVLNYNLGVLLGLAEGTEIDP